MSTIGGRFRSSGTQIAIEVATEIQIQIQIGAKGFSEAEKLELYPIRTYSFVCGNY